MITYLFTDISIFEQSCLRDIKVVFIVPYDESTYYFISGHLNKTPLQVILPFQSSYIITFENVYFLLFLDQLIRYVLNHIRIQIKQSSSYRSSYDMWLT